MKLLCILLAASTLLWCASPARADLVNAIEAIVDDAVITYVEVKSRNDQAEDTLVRLYRNDPAQLQKKLVEMQRENLEEMVKRQLILHEFKTAGYNLPESVLNDLVAESIKADFGDRATLTKTLEARGMTIDRYRQQIRERFIVAQLRLKNISQEIIISPHKVEAYYQANRETFKVEDEVKLRMIVITNPPSLAIPQPRKLAEEILGKLKEGASFAEMATMYSQDEFRSRGGERGWVERPVLRQELRDVAFSLKPGDLSSLIETPKEYYILQVEDVRTSHYKPLNEVRQQIETDLLSSERSRIEKQWIERLKKKTFVSTFF
jgi:parvulin-like peptidyl-prolyl isomerase